MKNILFYLLIVSCVVANQATYVLNSVSNQVKAGEFVYYYNFEHKGSITLNLHSISGDADLYIAHAPTTPTYEPNSYILHSATCGLDSVTIPSNLERPLNIGVYGHVSHEQSTYTLVAHFNDDEDVLLQDFDYSIIDPMREASNTEESESESDQRYSSNSGSGQGRHSGQHKRPAREKYRQSKPEEESSLLALIWPLIEILVDVLFL